MERYREASTPPPPSPIFRWEAEQENESKGSNVSSDLYLRTGKSLHESSKCQVDLMKSPLGT